ncbi:vascular endothelial growth factor C-like [Dendronephthya gigantea]|uniref:vascular endothelial growth factor C-like n=1 Tax=Dendronephthya gigantea TaxID=151771 RepID=UPI001068DC47|nr:vascular endothelial growth factor C-like [Dendronephthya gigantea]
MRVFIGVDCIVLLTTITLISSCFHTGTAKVLTAGDNEYCRPRPILISIDHPSYQYFPFFISLYRCGGSYNLNSPRASTCIPATIEDVTIRAQSLLKGQIKEFPEKNHTSCKRGCANKKEMCDKQMQVWNEKTCVCECKYPDGPPEPCPARFRWNRYICDCECNAEEHANQCFLEEKVWSSDRCGCECPLRVVNRCKRIGRVIDEKTCRCVVGSVVFGAQAGKDNDSGVSKPLLFGIIFGELLILLLVFDLALYCTKGWGLTHYVKKSVGKAFCRGNHKSPPLTPNKSHETTTYI